MVILLSMLFCHLVDDYYLQGILASMKQRGWWEKNAPDKMYRYDYIIALLEHAFSWAFMIHVPVIVCGGRVNIAVFVANWLIHAGVDHLKANVRKINLIEDQVIHIVQVVVTWGVYWGMGYFC